jgi:hypothetical protein
MSEELSGKAPDHGSPRSAGTGWASPSDMCKWPEAGQFRSRPPSSGAGQGEAACTRPTSSVAPARPACPGVQRPAGPPQTPGLLHRSRRPEACRRHGATHAQAHLALVTRKVNSARARTAIPELVDAAGWHGRLNCAHALTNPVTAPGKPPVLRPVPAPASRTTALAGGQAAVARLTPAPHRPASRMLARQAGRRCRSTRSRRGRTSSARLVP